MTSPQRVLYHVVCAAPPALAAADFVAQAQQGGWDVCVVTTSRAAVWLDLPALAAVSGHPVRTDYKLPGQPDVLPPPTAFAVVPATFNTINKWAAGIADTLVLGLLTEALGLGLPAVVAPCLTAAQAAHPAYATSCQTLRSAGVRMLDRWTPQDADRVSGGWDGADSQRALQELERHPHLVR
ncbi:flavoprotein [Frankia sp. CcI49]|uniref:flavoprotein n=1 Tax=Frankia sp. CcI49 TaxID=1745382 RepID=UPI000977FA8E|nr:flavoprotein [Frankia sp. CcI49]ONH58499.1 flavoprotein [Frankia sp. CcI49]